MRMYIDAETYARSLFCGKINVTTVLLLHLTSITSLFRMHMVRKYLIDC